MGWNPNYQRKRVDRVCSVCAAHFSAPECEVKRGRGKTCSPSCAASLAAANRDSAGQANANWKGGISNAERIARYRERYPEKYAAHRALRNGLRSGNIVRGICEQCGSADTEGHHDDYSKPLEVRWLCKAHHLGHHREAA